MRTATRPPRQALPTETIWTHLSAHWVRRAGDSYANLDRNMRTVREILARDPMEIFLPLAVFAGTFAAAWLVRRLALRAVAAWTSRSHSRSGPLMEKALRGPT